MDDIVPGDLEFSSFVPNESVNKPNDLLTLEDPPEEEQLSLGNINIDSGITNEISTNVTENDRPQSCSHPNEELLVLNEPPEEEKEEEEKEEEKEDNLDEIIDSCGNQVTAADISQFVQNLIDPIVKEAIENQSEELINDLSINGGDKKSDKSLSDDGFEYVKQDDVNQSIANQDDDAFLADELVIDNNHGNESILFPSVVPVASDDQEQHEHEQEQQEDSDKMAFDLEGIIEASNAGGGQESMGPIDDHSSTEMVPEERDEIEDTMESIKIVKECETPPLEESVPIESSRNEERESVSTVDSDICRKCRELFCWTDPILSVVVLSSVMIVELGLMCDYSVISLLAYSGLMLLVTSLVYKIGVKLNLMKKHGENNCGISITGDDIQVCIDNALSWVDYLFNEFKSLTYVVSFSKNLKAFIFFWMLTYIGQWFNLLSLIFIGTIILFSFPIIYITYKETIDQVINKTNDQIKDSIAKLKLKSRQLIGRRAT